MKIVTFQKEVIQNVTRRNSTNEEKNSVNHNVFLFQEH
jgi:hypothetical protein